MVSSVGKFIKQKNNKGYFAEVEVEVDTNVTDTFIALNCNGQGYSSQGYTELAPKVGYEDWKMGAIVGINFALKICIASPCKITISRIEGLTTDTNPTVVAAAATDAIWKAFEFQPTIEVKTSIENKVFSSWDIPVNAIPFFE